jgi:hypothetical protein
LTVTEVEDLRWLKSADGKLAKNLIRWNSGMLENLNCLEDVERLNVTLEVQGKKAESGFCLLWVVPSQDRKFTSEK